MVSDKYAKCAIKDFDVAIVKYKHFQETEIKRLNYKDLDKIKEIIDGFIEDLGCYMYCDEYIIAMVKYAFYCADKDVENSKDYLSLIVFILSHYVLEHSMYVNDDVKALYELARHVYHANVMLDLISRL